MIIFAALESKDLDYIVADVMKYLEKEQLDIGSEEAVLYIEEYLTQMLDETGADAFLYWRNNQWEQIKVSTLISIIFNRIYLKLKMKKR